MFSTQGIGPALQPYRNDSHIHPGVAHLRATPAISYEKNSWDQWLQLVFQMERGGQRVVSLALKPLGREPCSEKS